MAIERKSLWAGATLLLLFAADPPARAQLVTNSYLNASSATITTGDLGVGTSAATAVLDVRGGNIDMEQYPVEVFLSSATQSATVSSGGSWTAVTGESGSFTLARTMIVHMRANGSAGGSTGGATCGMRFVVDTVGQGDPTWGNVLFYNNAIDVPWTMELELSLASGPHTIAVQQISDVASGCNTDATFEVTGHLWIHGR